MRTPTPRDPRSPAGRRAGRRRALPARLAGLALVPLVAALAAWSGTTRPALNPADAGAPWLSLEIPANPLDEAHRDAVAVVRTYYHERPVDFALEGTAEGVVDGERRSVPLRLERTERPGAVVVRQTWPDEGEWTLVIGARGVPATLVAALGPDGGVVGHAYHGQPVRALVARSIDVRARSHEQAAAQVRARLDAVAARTR